MGTVLGVPGSVISGVPIPPASALLGPGSLGLIDLMNSKAPLPAGVPATGAVITDHARSLAQTLIGSDPGGFTVTNGVSGSSVKSKVERSVKGGIHFMNSRTAQASPYELFDIGLGAQRLAYINANPTHDFYLGAWFRVTRYGDSSYGNPYLPFGLRKGDPQTTPTDRWLLAGTNTAGSIGTLIITPPVGDARNGGALTRRDGSGEGQYSFFTGVCALESPASFTAIDRFVRMGAASAGGANKWPSIILYRLALIDLTVDGRTFTDVSTIDQTEYVKQVLTPGGTYYGDTWSDPTTVLP